MKPGNNQILVEINYYRYDKFAGKMAVSVLMHDNKTYCYILYQRLTIVDSTMNNSFLKVLFTMTSMHKLHKSLNIFFSITTTC